MNTELRNTVPLLQGKYRVGSSGHNSFVNQSVHNIVLCVFLFKDTYLIYTGNSLTLNSQPTAYVTRIFSIRHSTGFLHLGTLNGTSALHLGAIINGKMTKKKHKNTKAMALHRLQKGHLFTIRELKQGKAWPWFSLS